MPPRHYPGLSAANVSFDDLGTPSSLDYADHYFMPGRGAQESEYVFVQGNALPQRFAGLVPGSCFVIGETGFGSGLNFLVAAELFLKQAPAQCRLLFFSCELHPMTPSQLCQSHTSFPDSLQSLARSLREALPPAVAGGPHRLTFCSGRIELGLYLGCAKDALAETHFKVDAWFLDGFTPSGNSSMWQADLFSAMARRSHRQTTLASFTAAGQVRRDLQAAGFRVERIRGFANKRHMIRGEATTTREAIRPVLPAVTVVGAGIAGCTLADQLIQRGCQDLEILDLNAEPARGASGNPQGALYIKTGLEWTPACRLQVWSLQHALRYYHNLGMLQQSGVLAMAHTPDEMERQHRLLQNNPYPPELLRGVDPQEASMLAGLALPRGGLWYPQSGWVAPREVCHRLLERASLDLRQVNTPQLARHIAGARASGRRVVFCTGHLDTLPGLPPLRHPPRPLAGQVTEVAAMPPWQDLRCVLCGDGYVLPARAGCTLIGASFHPGDASCEPRPAEDEDNLQRLATLLDSAETRSLEVHSHRRSIRYAARDYLPAAGWLSADNEPPTACLAALGSKGLVLAPMLAAHVADLLCQQPQLLESDLAKRLSPQRLRA